MIEPTVSYYTSYDDDFVMKLLEDGFKLYKDMLEEYIMGEPIVQKVKQVAIEYLIKHVNSNVATIDINTDKDLICVKIIEKMFWRKELYPFGYSNNDLLYDDTIKNYNDAYNKMTINRHRKSIEKNKSKSGSLILIFDLFFSIDLRCLLIVILLYASL
jgi:hypothetical protein